MTPILDGKALLYSFVSTPEVRIGVAFGSGGSQSATELPGVSSWLVCFRESNLSKISEKKLMSIIYGKKIDVYHFMFLPHHMLLVLERSLRFQVSFCKFSLNFPQCHTMFHADSTLPFIQVKLFTDTLVKTMVEPRRRCYSLPAVNLRKYAVGGIIYVSVVSANKLSRNCFKGSPSWRQQNGTSNGCVEDNLSDKDLQTFVEVEVEELTRRTGVSLGPTPRWDATFNMVLHDSTGILRFNLYECPPDGVKYDYLACCEIKVLSSMFTFLS